MYKNILLLQIFFFTIFLVIYNFYFLLKKTYFASLV